MNMRKGIELWKRARAIIPGGTQLVSKRSERFLPEQWPSYYRKAKGVEIWDLDGNKLTDMSIMGIGSCILGYADDDVDAAVREAIAAGSMSTLNCPEEVELAETMLRLNPWAGMVHYARTGGEAMAVAVRIARAHSGRDRVAFCGYHGWHDWYLAANLADNAALDGHLLPGLEPRGVPRGLIHTSLPFNYNKIEELKAIVDKHDDIGAIVMEPIRHHPPEDDFLGKVRKIADKVGAVLVFDEITAGWRLRVGGAYAEYGGKPDIAVFGKAMSNGYPMAAMVGKRDVMEAANSTFISSTYWTDRIGPAASIATIAKMQEKKVPAHLCRIGRSISAGLEKLAKEHGLRIHTEGLPPMPIFGFDHENAQALHTLFTQEMLGQGILASKAVYVSFAHQEKHVAAYLEAVDKAFGVVKKAVEKKNVASLLKGPAAEAGFKRLA